jgi:hypothetical protein
MGRHPILCDKDVASPILMGYIGCMLSDPKKLVSEMVDLVGSSETERLLILANVSPSLAGKLRRGTYKSEIGRPIAACIEKALEQAKRKAKAS